MNKKISAAFIIMLFTLSVVSLPVQAHFTLGKYTNTYDYHTLDYDGEATATEIAHIPGLTGYVFPGAGPLTSPAPGFINTIAGQNVKGYPGYQTLYPDGNPAGSPQGWLQAEGNSYAPFGAILTSTIKVGSAFNKLFLNGNPTIWGPRDNEVDALPIEHQVRGDLIFAVNYTLPAGGWGAQTTTGGIYWFDRMEIWIPPEFQNVKKENIVASFTNDWGNIASTTKPDYEAEIVPNGFTRVRVSTDTMLGGTKANSYGLTYGNMLQFGNSTLGDVWAWIRVNDVIAPTIAGKYFFKMGLRLRAPTALIPANLVGTGTAETSKMVWLGNPGSIAYHTFNTNGVPNFPVLLVKGEVDPAYVEGTIRYGGYAGANYYGQPLQLAGRVRLIGRAIDPFTLAPTNRPVEARGYFNQTAGGHFEVEGVAPGIYDIYASAAGYPEKLIQTGVSILKGQSYHIDAYLTPGVVIEGEVFSKCGTGEVNWVTWQHNITSGETRQDMKIEIYKVGEVPTSSGKTCKVTQEDVENIACFAGTQAVTWSPVTIWSLNAIPGWGAYSVQFPWPGYGGVKPPIGADSNGVGPAQQWQVVNTQANFRFKFGDKGLYGAPAMFDGHVPQLNATWVDGLPAGSYEVRAFTYGYVQTKADGVTFEHVTFNVPAVEWPGDIYVPFDLRLSNYVTKTVHVHDIAGTLIETPIPGTATLNPGLVNGNENRTIYVKVEDQAGATWGWKTFPLLAGQSQATITTRGIRAETPSYWGSGAGRNYGIESGLYTIKAFMWGYVEQVFEKVTIGLCGSEIRISDHMYRGVMFNVTFYSKDWEHPTADKSWMYPDEFVYLQIWKAGKQLTGYGYDGASGTAAGSTSSGVSGGSYVKTAAQAGQQPFGVVGEVRSSYRIRQGYYVNYVLRRGWNDPAVSASAKTFTTLYYEGQDAYHIPSKESNYYYDNDWNVYPQSFESGRYDLVGMTYGYVNQMDPVTRAAKPFQVYATKGAVSNIAIKLIIGVQIPLIVRFKHERIFEGLRYNSSVRVRVFDDKDSLVGEWLTSGSINGSMGWPRSTTAGRGYGAGDYISPFRDHVSNLWPTDPERVIKGLPESSVIAGGARARVEQLRNVLGPGYTFRSGITDALHPAGVIETVNYVPRGTMMLNLTICGIPDPYSIGSGWSSGATAGIDRVFDVAPWKPGKYGAPGAPYGISGDPWYMGGYTVEVEVVPFSRDISARDSLHLVKTPILAAAAYVYQAWYPPVEGIVFGESCAIDPRSGKLYSWAMGVNHIGPYQQRVNIVLPGAHLGGESSGILELDHLGLARGVAYSYTWCDDWRTTSWIQVQFSGAPGILNYYTFDGSYVAYLPAGTWKMDVVPWLAGAKAPGYGSQSFTLAIGDGQASGYNVYLEETGVPIPEFSTALVVLVSALAAALSILRRRRK